MKKLKLIITSTLFLLTGASFGQITVTNIQTPTELVEDVLAGPGVVVSNIEFNYSIPLATTVQSMAGYFDATGTDFPMAKGVILATGNCMLAVGPNDTGSGTDNTGAAVDPNDVDLNAISTAVVNNECILEFDFIPSGDSVVFNYIFGSEEYPEFVGSIYNDVFGFFISGPGISGPYTSGAENIALIPGSTTPVAINNVNNGTAELGPCVNCEYYVSNAGGVDVQYDAFTTVLQAASSVICGETYHIKIALGDAGDMAWDSGVFLEASSFASSGVSVQIASATGSDDITEGCDSAIVCFTRPAEADSVDMDITYDIGGTATNGVDYPFLDGFITMPAGEDTVCFYITPTMDALSEPTETVLISVSYLNACGDSVTTTGTFNIIDPEALAVTSAVYDIDCPTDSTEISAIITGGVGPYEYIWSTGSTEPTTWVPALTPGTVSYDLDVVDQCGETASITIDVTVDPAPMPTITFNEDLFILCPEEEVLVTSDVTDPYSLPIEYLWSPTGETTADITASPGGEGWYYLTINDGCYEVTDSVEFQIGGVDLTDIIVTDATDCPGAPTSTPGSIQILPDDPSWTYEIIGYVPPQTSGFFPGLDGGINYIVSITDENGCNSDTVVYVGLGDNAVTADFIIDSLRDVTCFGWGDGGAFVDNIGGGLMPPYEIEWAHTTGTWSTTPGIPSGGSNDIDNLFGGTWTVTITDEFGCAWSYTFDIFEPEEFVLDINYNAPSCYQWEDGSVTALTEGGNGGLIFEIKDEDSTLLNPSNSNTANSLGEGWYFVTVTDANGCNVSGTVFVNDPDLMEIDLDVFQPQCYGVPSGYAEVDTIIGYNGSYDSLVYLWNPYTGSGPGGYGANFQGQMGPGDYILTVNDANGCSNEYEFTIVYPPELVFNELGLEPAYCRLYPYQSGNGVVYAAAGGGTPDYTYEWKNLGTGETTTNTTWGGLNPGDYEIKIVDANGCVLYQKVVLDSINPVADFDAISAQFLTPGVCEGTAIVDVEFINTSTGFANPNNPFADTTFFWHFGYDGLPWVISHDYYEIMDTTYYEGGVYPVCLIAQNKNGCKDTTCKDMIIFDPLIFNPVNVFTPDNDGINDLFTFEFVSQAVDQFHAVIVNRWGKTLHEINDITEGWDGTDKGGQKVTDGVYFYTYEGVAENGDTFKGQGTITLVSNGK